MEAVQLKIPKPKMTIKASFSLFGRCIDNSVLIGKAMSHMSSTMWMPDVAFECQYIFRCPVQNRLTVEQGCGTDTMPFD